MLSWLGWRLNAISWAAVWGALPTRLAFYALVLAAYLVLPLAMHRGDITAITAIHAARFTLGLALLAAQWWLVLPSLSNSALLTLLAVYVLVGRAIASPSLAVSSRLTLDQAPLAQLLIATSALQQVLHLAVFALAGSA